MSDYRRLISYIYEYEDKEKGKNVGFVKMEARNGQCRMNLSVKNIYVGGNAIGVYLLGKDGVKTFLGNVFVRGGNGEFRTTVDVKNVEGTGNELDTYYGMTVHDVKNSWRSYTTIWEDAAAVPEILGSPLAQEVLPGAEDVEGEKMRLSVAEEIEAELEQEDGAQAAETQPEVPKKSEPISPSPELEDPDVLKYLQETEDPVMDPEQLWQELRKNYPKIDPFDYDGRSEVLTIRPQDIGRLPREVWVYGNNSFLMHGYYNFRYLILVRLENNNGEVRYLLGIPGHYYSNEKYMATMFGFPNFVLSKKQPPNDGRFGYWYTEIKMRG